MRRSWGLEVTIESNASLKVSESRQIVRPSPIGNASRRAQNAFRKSLRGLIIPTAATAGIPPRAHSSVGGFVGSHLNWNAPKPGCKPARFPTHYYLRRHYSLLKSRGNSPALPAGGS